MESNNGSQKREFRQTKKMIERFTIGRIDAAFLSLVVVVLLFAVIDTYLTLMTPLDRHHPFRFSPGTWITSRSIRFLQLKYLGEVALLVMLTIGRHLFPRKLLIYQRFIFAGLVFLFTAVIIVEHFFISFT